MWKERRKKEKEKKNNAKFSGHYVCPRTHNVQRTHYVRTKSVKLHGTARKQFLVISKESKNILNV